MVHYDFAGKVVLVTGSSRGMGAAVLEVFALIPTASIAGPTQGREDS